MDYIGLTGLFTLVSQTLLSRSRWTLRRYCPYHRPTEAAVRQIGLADAAHERMVTHIGLSTLLLRTLHSQILGYAHRFCTRSSHAHKTRKRFCHVRWIPKRRSHNHRIHRRSWSCTFTNSAVTNSVLAYAPVYEHRTRKRSSHERRTRKRPVTHSGHTNGSVTYAVLPDAAVTTLVVSLVSQTLLSRWLGERCVTSQKAAAKETSYWMDYIGLVGLITLVSQPLLSLWLAIGRITLD